MPEIAVADPVGALVPHTLQQQISGSGSGLLAGRTFMVKDCSPSRAPKSRTAIRTRPRPHRDGASDPTSARRRRYPNRYHDLR